MPRRGVPITEPGRPQPDGFSTSADEHAIKDHAPQALLLPAPDPSLYQAKHQH
jgi:hypothetical protein